MKLVVIYGPPAVGKLTVATELSKITGYKVFHNHLAIDFIESVLDRSNGKFWELLDKYRLELIEAAAQEKAKGMIITSVHIKNRDDKFIKNLLSIMDKNNGMTHFVRLSCDRKIIEERLQKPSRKKYGKLTDYETFSNFVKSNDVFSEIGFVKSYNVDNTELPPEETAKMIKAHFKL